MNEKQFTIEQAASQLGVRSDDLVALLPSAGINLEQSGETGPVLTESDMAALNNLMSHIHQLHKEGDSGIE